MSKRSAADLAERVDFVRELVVRCCTKGTIKAAVRKRFGETNFKTVESYITRAREDLARDLATGRDILRAHSLAMYRLVLADPAARYGDKIRAQERIDKLLGLECPQQVEVLGTGKATHEADEPVSADPQLIALHSRYTAELARATAGGSDDAGGPAVGDEPGPIRLAPTPGPHQPSTNGSSY